jgi:hypothetical protein
LGKAQSGQIKGNQLFGLKPDEKPVRELLWRKRRIGKPAKRGSWNPTKAQLLK